MEMVKNAVQPSVATNEGLGMRLEVIRAETMNKLNELFREKVQLQEMVETNESNLQYNRGYMDGLQKVQELIIEQEKAQQTEKIAQQRIDALKARTNSSTIPVQTVADGGTR